MFCCRARFSKFKRWRMDVAKRQSSKRAKVALRLFVYRWLPQTTFAVGCSGGLLRPSPPAEMTTARQDEAGANGLFSGFLRARSNARAIRQLEFGLCALHTLEQARRAGCHVRNLGESWVTGRQGVCHRFHHRAGAPACSRGKTYAAAHGAAELPEPPSPTTLQLFLPRSIPRTAIKPFFGPNRTPLAVPPQLGGAGHP